MPERRLLLALSLIVGVASGFAAVLLKLAIHWIRTGLTGWIPADSPWRFLYIVLPGAGMLIAFIIVRYVVRDKIGHGVTRVLRAVSKNDSRIKPHNCWSSMVTSAVTIGFGGSVGAEAPIVYTGAAIGSNLGRALGLSWRGTTILLGCGAAGAVAGMFNAPLAGVLFTLEILLFNISMTAILPLLTATVSATVVSYACLGRVPFLGVDGLEAAFSLSSLPFYVVLGIFCAAVSLYFTRVTLSLEDGLARLRNPFLRWGLCAAGLGLMIFLLPELYGEGYESLRDLLSSNASAGSPLFKGLNAAWLLPVYFLAVMLLKVLAMTFTNAGGGVGGTFGPTLVVGGIAGFVVASSLNLIKPDLVPQGCFVLVGMAGLMAGVMQAPMTAIFLIAEISGGYSLLIPLIITSAISYGLVRIFEKYSIYTKRIAQSGELLTHDSDQAVLTLLKTSSLVETDFTPVEIDSPLGSLVESVSASHRNVFPVVDSRSRFQGYLTLEDIRHDMFKTELYDKRHVFNYMHSAEEYVYPDESMDSVMGKFEKTGAWNLPVVDADTRKYLGFVSKSKIFSAYRDSLRDFSQD